MKILKLYMGIDIGSTFIKAAITDGEEIAYEKMETGWNPAGNSEIVISRILKRFDCTKEAIVNSVSTGYGRNYFPSSQQFTEITCHALGSAHLFPEVDYLIDVGGQDSKVVLIDSSGKVLDFIMNDKCSAGTGKFLQIMAERMGMDMEQFSKAANMESPSEISSMCTVFAETEIIGLVAVGEPLENIIGGVFCSVAKRIAALACKKKGQCGALVGGGGKFDALKVALESELEMKLQTHEYSEFTGALGAMLLARKGDKNGTGFHKKI